ncbi:hypothetical protein ACFSUK_01310 [Sphingobium scionense]
MREQLQDRDSVVADLRQRLDKSEDERREAQARVIGLLTGPEPAESSAAFLVGCSARQMIDLRAARYRPTSRDIVA